MNLRLPISATVIAALVSGCVASAPPSRNDLARAEYAAANRQRDEYSARRQEEGQRRATEKRERLGAEDAERKREGDKRAADARAAEESLTASACAADRPQREAEMQRRMDSVAHVDELREWEAEHCHREDNSVAVTRVVQDSRGEYHTVAGRSRGVDRVCDAKKPKEIDTQSARDLRVYQISVDVSGKNTQCKALDVEVSAIAKAYWAE